MKNRLLRWIAALLVGAIAVIGTELWGVWFLIGCALIGAVLIGIGGFPDE